MGVGAGGGQTCGKQSVFVFGAYPRGVVRVAVGKRESASGVPETGHCDKDEHVPGDQIVCLKVISKPSAGGSYRWPEARQETGVSGVFSSHCAGHTDSVLFTAWNSSLLWRRFAHMKVCSFYWRSIWQLTSGMEFSLVTC